MFLGVYLFFSVSNVAAATLYLFPEDMQLYPRDLTTNLADIPISGLVNPNATIAVDLNIYRNGTLSTTIPLTTPGFSLTVQIPAELANYNFELVATDVSNNQSVIGVANDVVAGDVYLINGQSNAEARQYDGSAASQTSPFIRSFGSSDAVWSGDLSWHTALGNCGQDVGCVGQWGIRFARQLVTWEKVPVAVINGARGGHQIAYFERNDADPDDLTTNYGRLLTRATEAGVVDNIRAIFWYQGESDNDPSLPAGSDTTGYTTQLTDLYNDWQTDFAPEHTYLFQIRTACSFGQGAGTSNQQREFALAYDDVTAISTTGLDGHDGCHYSFSNGYYPLGLKAYMIVRDHLYGRYYPNADSPDITSAKMLNSTQMELTFTPHNEMRGDAGFEALFQLRDNNSGQLYTPSAGTVIAYNNHVILDFPQSISDRSNLTLSYYSPSGNQNWLTNTREHGILTFLDYPVAPLTVDQFPVDLQLYARDLDTNLATVPVSGTADTSHTMVTLNVYRNGVLWNSVNQALSTTAQFSLTVQIPAELVNYDFELIATDVNSNQITLATASDVVAGDVYLVNGQSNASATGETKSYGVDETPFVRTFGLGHMDWYGELNWHIAKADCGYYAGCIGQWSLRFGSNIVNTEQLPIAILNAARGGQPITHFERNDADLTDLTTNYGRLLTRAIEAGVQDDIRAILWYQGEAGSNEPDVNIAGFTELYNNWHDDFAPIEHVYIMQIRSGCSGGAGSGMSNAQRLFAQARSSVTAISTTGLDGHDGCHYYYLDGYQQLGDNVTRILRDDLYDANLADSDAADIISAQIIMSNTVKLSFTPNNQLVADPNFESLFEIRDNIAGNTYTFVDGSINGTNDVFLTLPQNLTDLSDLSISYYSPNGDQDWLTNAAGIGVLSFLNFPVSTSSSTLTFQHGGDRYDGSSGDVVPHSSDLDVASNNRDFSAGFWIKPEEGPTGEYRAIAYKGTTNKERLFAMWLRPDNMHLLYRISTTNSWNEGRFSNQPLPINEWTYIAYVHEGGKLKLYINGVLDSETTLSGSVLSNSGNLYIGDTPWYAGMKGQISAFSTYNSALPSGWLPIKPSSTFGFIGDQYDGSSGDVVPHSSDLDVASNNRDFSAEFWIKPEEGPTGEYRAIAYKGTTSKERLFAMWLRPDNMHLLYRISTTSSWNEGRFSNQPLPINEWTHVAYVREGNKLKLYLNGILDSETTLSGSVINNNGDLYIGDTPWYAGMKGKIADFNTYNIALTSEMLME